MRLLPADLEALARANCEALRLDPDERIRGDCPSGCLLEMPRYLVFMLRLNRA